ncbi:hypothetical protein [Bradyrhizobium sp. AZCC 2230]|uniref:hypothetical protein n=1 Tax=Bradyrhizobium sp. AZCC 2230 TaxID=3117021 RepID=UPI003022D109
MRNRFGNHSKWVIAGDQLHDDFARRDTRSAQVAGRCNSHRSTGAALPLHAVYPETHWMSLRARSFLDLLVERAEHFAPASSHTPAAGAGG